MQVQQAFVSFIRTQPAATILAQRAVLHVMAESDSDEKAKPEEVWAFDEWNLIEIAGKLSFLKNAAIPFPKMICKSPVFWLPSVWRGEEARAVLEIGIEIGQSQVFNQNHGQDL